MLDFSSIIVDRRSPKNIEFPLDLPRGRMTMRGATSGVHIQCGIPTLFENFFFKKNVEILYIEFRVSLIDEYLTTSIYSSITTR